MVNALTYLHVLAIAGPSSQVGLIGPVVTEGALLVFGVIGVGDALLMNPRAIV